MAQITTTNKGFMLADKVKLNGRSLHCEFTFNVQGEAGYDPRAPYFEKFRAYFAQHAAQSWN